MGTSLIFIRDFVIIPKYTHDFLKSSWQKMKMSICNNLSLVARLLIWYHFGMSRFWLVAQLIFRRQHGHSHKKNE